MLYIFQCGVSIFYSHYTHHSLMTFLTILTFSCWHNNETCVNFFIISMWRGRRMIREQDMWWTTQYNTRFGTKTKTKQKILTNLPPSAEAKGPIQHSLWLQIYYAGSLLLEGEGVKYGNSRQNKWISFLYYYFY